MSIRHLSVLPLVVALFAPGQETRIMIRAVDGRNGKPLADQRLVVFSGLSPEDVRVHKGPVYDVTTDKAGNVDLTIDLDKTKVIRIFVDFMHACSGSDIDVAEIVSTGISAPNTCGTQRVEVTPNRLVIFARPRTLREEMQQ